MWLCIQYPWIPRISPFIVKQPPIFFSLPSLGASVLWQRGLWCFLNRFSFIWDIGIKFRQQSVETVVFRRARKKLNGKREKNNTGEKRDFFIAILRCLFQCDICASFNRFSLQSRKLLMIAAGFSLFRIGARKLARIFKLCKFSLSNGLFICSKECGEWFIFRRILLTILQDFPNMCLIT